MTMKRQQELIDQLSQICSELGWDIVIPGRPEDTIVDGLIIGKEEFVQTVSEILDAAGLIDIEETEVFDQDPVTGELVEMPKMTKKINNLH